jgi:hypothetical protein
MSTKKIKINHDIFIAGILFSGKKKKTLLHKNNMNEFLAKEARHERVHIT